MANNCVVIRIDHAIAVYIFVFYITWLNIGARIPIGRNRAFQGIYARARIVKITILVHTIPYIAIHHPQRLADFRRVVVADNALPVTQMGAQDLADYAGRISGQKIEVTQLSKYDANLDGLSFFVGEVAGEKALGQKLGPLEN